MFVKFNAYNIIQRAVEEGVRYGIQKAHKHTNSPSEDVLENEIEKAVMQSLWEVIDMSDTVKIETKI